MVMVGMVLVGMVMVGMVMVGIPLPANRQRKLRDDSA